MSKDRRAALVMQIMAEFMRHPGRSSKAAEAALDIALKAAAEVADAEMAVLIRNAKIAVEAGDDAAHYKANAAWWSVRRVRNAILALISEGVSR